MSILLRVVAAHGRVARLLSTGQAVLEALAGGEAPEVLIVSSRIQSLNATDLLAELSRTAPSLRTVLLVEEEDAASVFVAALEVAKMPLLWAPLDARELLRSLRRGLSGTMGRLGVIDKKVRDSKELNRRGEAVLREADRRRAQRVRITSR